MAKLASNAPHNAVVTLSCPYVGNIWSGEKLYWVSEFLTLYGSYFICIYSTTCINCEQSFT